MNKAISQYLRKSYSDKVLNEATPARNREVRAMRRKIRLKPNEYFYNNNIFDRESGTYLGKLDTKTGKRVNLRNPEKNRPKNADPDKKNVSQEKKKGDTSPKSDISTTEPVVTKPDIKPQTPEQIIDKVRKDLARKFLGKRKKEPTLGKIARDTVASIIDWGVEATDRTLAPPIQTITKGIEDIADDQERERKRTKEKQYKLALLAAKKKEAEVAKSVISAQKEKEKLTATELKTNLRKLEINHDEEYANYDEKKTKVKEKLDTMDNERDSFEKDTLKDEMKKIHDKIAKETTGKNRKANIGALKRELNVLTTKKKRELAKYDKRKEKKRNDIKSEIKTIESEWKATKQKLRRDKIDLDKKYEDSDKSDVTTRNSDVSVRDMDEKYKYNQIVNTANKFLY